MNKRVDASSFPEIGALFLASPGVVLAGYWLYGNAPAVIDPVGLGLAWFALGVGLLAPCWNGPKRARVLAAATNLGSLAFFFL